MAIDRARYDRARQGRVTIGDFVLVFLRPSPYAVAELSWLGRRFDLAFAEGLVVGWENVRESDLIPGGDPVAADFDRDLFSAWLRDRPDFWEPLTTAVVESYTRYQEAREQQKNG